MSTEGILPPPSEAEYWRELATLRHKQIGYLMSGNHLMYAGIDRKIKELEARADSPVPHTLGQEKRQSLLDAVAALNKAVQNILE